MLGSRGDLQRTVSRENGHKLIGERTIQGWRACHSTAEGKPRVQTASPVNGGVAE